LTSTPSHTSAKRIWFITGTSQGFGRELVNIALQQGDSVVATSRDPQKVKETFPRAGERLLALSVDLRDPASISAGVDAALAKYGRIDVLINNAGHGMLGAVEEVSAEEVAKVFDINVDGLLTVTRTILPQMRQQRSGHIINLSSIGGLVGIAGYGIYNATKFAVEGLSEALAIELAPLGIKVTVVEPGPFRTDFLGGSLARAEKVIEDYAETSGKTRAAALVRHGAQPGDPIKAAEAILKVIQSEKPPVHLILGKFAFERANQKFDEIRAEFEAWKSTALGADFPS
jgi:NAD(P)-dependent dehydrogenase (short-subunit alcohol dehydrogenase family)